MALGKLWVIAYRDLGRNRRRSILTLLAVALGLMLLIVLNSWIAGILADSLENAIRLQTGHVQLRANSYEEEKVSLQWQDLLSDIDTLNARANALSEVRAATPVLWATAVLNTADDSQGLRLYGIDTASAIYEPVRSTLVAGDFLTSDDREGILLGQRLASNLDLSVGQTVNLTIINSDGEPDEGTFTIRGLFSSGVPNYDNNAVFMPLAKAQAITRTAGRASAIFVLLNRQEDAETVAAALRTPEITALTWQEMNSLFIQTFDTAMSFYVILDAIVMLVVAVVIANTLLMAVFERVREIGILAALGMKGRQIIVMFLMEATILGLAGVVVGIGLSLIGVSYLANVGVSLGNMGDAAQSIALSATMYARFVPDQMLSLSLWTLAIILLASLYPAWYAARMEPVDALRGQ
jgi:ABC-type lipoprotein release transport system permease subunit